MKFYKTTYKVPNAYPDDRSGSDRLKPWLRRQRQLELFDMTFHIAVEYTEPYGSIK